MTAADTATPTDPFAAAPPTMRVTHIALDHNELPYRITVVASMRIIDRIVNDLGGINAEGGEPCGLPIYTAALIAKHFGSVVPSDEVTSEIWSCLTNIFNRFWDGGLFEYLNSQGDNR